LGIFVLMMLSLVLAVAPIRCEKLIRDGVVADQSELARCGHLTTARMTQIMALLNLAPDLQEQILHLPRVERGRNTVQETVAPTFLESLATRRSTGYNRMA